MPDISETFTFCGTNPEISLPNALAPHSGVFYSRRNGSVVSLDLQCVNSSRPARNYSFTCMSNGQWQVAYYSTSFA